jgi:hypothetical protein
MALQSGDAALPARQALRMSFSWRLKANIPATADAGGCAYSAA